MADPRPDFDVAAARADGVSDADIATFLAPKLGFNLEQARKDGVNDTAIVDFLSPPKAPAAPAEPPKKATAGDDWQRGIEQSRAGFGALGAAVAGARLSDVEAAKKKADAGEYLSPIERERARQYDEAKSNAQRQLGEGAGQFVEATKRAEALPISPGYKAFQEAQSNGTIGDVVSAFWKAPIDVLTSMIVEGTPATMPALAAGLIAGPAGGMAVGGAQGFGQSYANTVMDLLGKRGVDVNDKEAIAAALANPEIADEIRTEAAKGAVPQAAAGALGMGAGAITMAPAKLAARPLMQQAVNIPAQMGVQGAIAAGGEAGEKVALGEEVSGGKALGAFIGGASQGPVDVATFAAHRTLFGEQSPKVVADKVMAAPTVDAAIAEATAIVGQPVDTESQAIGAREFGGRADQQQAKMLKLFAGLNDGTVEVLPGGQYQYRIDDQAVPLKVWDERTPAVEGVKTISPELAATQRRVYGQMGIDVVYIADDGSVPFDGAVSPRNPDTIFLSNDPQRNAANVGAHEVTHVLETVTTPDGQRLGDLMHDMIVKNVTGAGIDQYIKVFGQDAPARLDFEDGPRGDSLHADAVWRHITQELGADIGGEAPKFPTFVAKVVDEVQTRYGVDAAKGVMRKLMDGIQQAMRRLREMFSKGDAGAEFGVPDTVSQNWLTNLGEFHDLLAKGYAEKFGTAAERENVALRDMRDRLARQRFFEQPGPEIQPPTAPAGFTAADVTGQVRPDPGVTDQPQAPTPIQEPGAGYQEAAQRIATYRRWIGELDAQRRQEAPNSPQVRLLQQTEASILGKVKGIEDRLTGAATARLAQVREQLAGLLTPDGDTADMTRLRQAILDEQGKLARAAAVGTGPAPATARAGAPVAAGRATEAAPSATRGRAVMPEDVAQARADTDTAPTDGQKEAGNYSKGRLSISGIPFVMENPVGSIRRGVDGNGKAWESKLPADYGYVSRTIGADGDQVDAYVGPDHNSQRAWVIDQIDPKTGRLDEHKMMLGFSSPEAAIAAYDGAFSDGSGPRRRAAVTETTLTDLKQWLADGDTKRPFAPNVPPAAAPAAELVAPPANETKASAPEPAPELVTPPPAEIEPGELPTDFPADRTYSDKVKAEKDRVWADKSIMGRTQRGLPADQIVEIGKMYRREEGETPEVAFDRAFDRWATIEESKALRATDDSDVYNYDTLKSEGAGDPILREMFSRLEEVYAGEKEKPGDADVPFGPAETRAPEGAGDEAARAEAGRRGGGETGAEPGSRGEVSAQPQTPRAPLEAPARQATPDHQFADEVARMLQDVVGTNVKIPGDDLARLANRIYGGTLAEGKFSRDQVYDAIELGVNRLIQDNPERFSAAVDIDKAKQVAEVLEKLKKALPTQTVRAGEKDAYQQFSTPPDYAYAANWVANLKPSDHVLEPSAGVGGLIVHSMTSGVRETTVNELSDKRRGMIAALEPTRITGEDAAQLHNILPETVRPTVVVMNPPFSRAAERMGGKMVQDEGAKHIEQALARLEPGGRLVAIVGDGMKPFGTVTEGGQRQGTGAAFRDWWNKIGREYDVRANVGVDRDIYTKYGTSFPTRFLVIDKNPPSGRELITGQARDAVDLIDRLQEVRNDRTVEPVTPQSDLPRVPEGGERAGGGRRELPGATGGMVAGEGGRARPAAEGAERAGAPSDGGLGGSAAGTRAGRSGAGDAVVPVEPQPVGERAGTVAAEPTAAGEDAAGRSADRGRDDARLDDGLEQTVVTDNAAPDEGEGASIYEAYKPQRVRVAGAKAHPGALVQSAAMASVLPPNTDYRPRIPAALVKDGALSDAQLEAITYAGNAHSDVMANGKRRGFFIGDGTGVGKGREIAGIFLDNKQQGRKKGIWLSEKRALFNDAKRDWSGLMQPASEIIDVGKFKAGDDIPAKSGILFLSYDTLKSAEQTKVEGERVRGRERIDQIVDWLGKDFDGVIAFDEAHNMGNAVDEKGTRGVKKASAKALFAVALQDRLPNARVVYVSATGASEVSNLSFADRLGLWGEGTAFPTRQDFVSKVSEGGVAAMELVARDMKALGHYTARNLSYDGVDYGRVEHKLTPDQRAIYDKLAEGWQHVLQNFNAALEMTGATEDGKTLDARAKSAAMSAFWGGHQRFFNQIITSMQMPSVIKGVEADLKAGRQAVLQLVNTMEASQERALEKSKARGDGDIEDLDLTPRDQLIQLVEKSFPVQQMETYLDDKGNERSRPAKDSQGNPILNKQAVAARERLIDELASIRVPDGPLEMVLNHFGPDMVAEVTGRGQRVVRKADDAGDVRATVEKRGGQANIAEAAAFQDGKKKILIFSEAGGTGRSYHAAIGSGSEGARRSHYLVQGGWRADKAVQGFGRTHRTSQASAPIFNLVTTDLQGQKRFISSIARRLGQLGALTKGERRTGDQGMFSARDNLESDEARAALGVFFRDVIAGQVEGVTMTDLEQGMGLKMRDSDGNLAKEMPPMSTFLNRVLSLTIDHQNRVFDAFSERLDDVIAKAEKAGTLDTGIESYKADKISKVSEQVVFTDPRSGAETKHVHLLSQTRNRPVSFDETMAGRNKTGGRIPEGFVRNERSGRVFAVTPAGNKTDANGNIIDQIRLTSPTDYDIADKSSIERGNWEKLTAQEARTLWDAQVAATPEFRKSDLHVITGAVLPIWDRLGGSPKIYRLQTDSGERMLARVIPAQQVERTLAKLGAEANKVEAPPAEIGERILQGGTAVLANDWKIRASRVAGERRLEVVGPDYRHFEELKRNGVFSERIDYKVRFFIPTEPTAMAAAIEGLTKSRPVVSLDGGAQFSPKSTEPAGPTLLDTREATADELAARQRVQDKALAEVGMRGKKQARTGQEVADDLPLFGGDRQGTLFSPKQVETPEFRRWFGDSKVVDEEGKPRVVYHGTVADITEFDPGMLGAATGAPSAKQGFFFSSSPDVAGSYAVGYNDYEAKPFLRFVNKMTGGLYAKANEAILRPFGLSAIEHGENIVPAYLSIKNPLVIEFNGKEYRERSFAYLLERARAGGHDGAVFRDAVDPGYKGGDMPSDIYVAFEPGQIKSAIGNDGSFDRSNNDIRYSPKPFYSALTRGVEGLKLDKATPGQWEATVKNMPGVKAEERAWVGLEDWLKQQPKSVTKAEVLDYLRANEIKVDEVEKGAGRMPAEAVARLKKWADDTYGDSENAAGASELDFDGLARGDRDAIEGLEAWGAPDGLMAPIYAALGKGGPVKFASYALPGGENYRELLLTLPEKTVTETYPGRWSDARQANGRGPWYLVDNGGEWGTTPYATRAEAAEHFTDSRSVTKSSPDNFRGSHWDEPNVLAHIRFDDRTGPNGEKVLHIAEVQSDWHQKGRKQGYNRGDKSGWQEFEARGYTVAKDGEFWMIYDQNNDPVAEGATRQAAIDDIVARNPGSEGGVPDAPFKTTWPELAMKRMLRYAAENGYDRVSWDTGETNADRFDLSKSIDRIVLRPEQNGTMYHLEARGLDGATVMDKRLRNADEVAQFIGKEPTERLFTGENKEKLDAGAPATLEGAGLKVGGEGMAAFYDKQLPVIAGKLGKKFGAKVEAATIPTTDVPRSDYSLEQSSDGWHVTGADYESPAYATKAEAQAKLDGFMGEIAGQAPAHSIAITDAMREGVMQGQPLFSPKIAGANPNRTYTPAERKAFENVGRAMEPFSVRAWIDQQTDNLGKRVIAKTLDPYIGIKASDPAGYMALRNANTTSGALEVFKEFGTIKFEGNAYALDRRNGGVDNSLIKPLQGEASDFIWWVAANRAERLKAEDRENLWSAEDIAVIKKTNEGELGFDYTLANGSTTRSRAEAYTDSLRKLDTFNKNALDLAIESGLLKRDQVDALWSNPFYVPFYRQAEGERQFIGPNVKGGFVKQHAFKQLKGGSEKLRTHLWENAFGNWEHMIDAAMSNRAVAGVLETASGAGGPAREMTLQEVKYLSDKELKKRTVWIMRDGEKVYYEITDPMLFDAVSTLESLADPLRLLTAGRWFKKVLTVGVTLNPGFAARNLIRDTQQTMATAPSSLNIAANMATGFGMSDLRGSLKNVARAAAGLELAKLNLSDDAVSAIAGGATMRLATGTDSGIRDTKLSAILDTPESVKGFTNYLGTLANAYREVIGQGEDVNRFSLYRKLRSEGVPHDAASFAARDLADFTLSGAATPVRYIIGVVPFLNARLQGLYKVGRAATNADAGVNAAAGLGTKSSTGRLATVLAASALAMMALDAIYQDDEDYKKRTEFDRNTYFWFKFGNAQIRIPMGFEIAALGRMASNTAEAFYDKEMTVKRVMENGWALLGQQLQMNPIPQAVKPIFDLRENESGTGRRIEPMGSEKLRPEQRYNANSTLIARGASTAMNAAMRATPGLSHTEGLSPLQIDYLVGAYGGWLATQALGMADMVVRSVSNEPVKPARDFWAVATQGMVSTEPRAESRYVDMLYKQGGEIERTYATYRDMLMRGQVGEAQRFFDDNREALQKHGLVSGLMRLESDLNRQIRMVTNNPDPNVTAEQKKLQIMRLTKLKSDAAERVFSVR